MQHDGQGRRRLHVVNLLFTLKIVEKIRLNDRRIYGPARRDTPGLLMAPDEASWEALHEVLLG